ncbi:MAG: redoxin domain-containing protein [Flavobacteriaceae bacterium]|nr:redoxin domain-containing protein [Flavobacteriaceae bacterium]
MKVRKIILALWLVIVFAGIAFLFWHNEGKYSLPTPVPVNYIVVNRGDKINFGNKITISDKPLFLHFFNPECPRSRFNLTHFKSLVKKYTEKLKFAVVVMDEDGDYTTDDIIDKIGLNINVLFDTLIAVACGVYSTPQAAIITTDKNFITAKTITRAAIAMITIPNLSTNAH